MIAEISWYRRRLMTPVNMLFCWHLGLAMMLIWWAAILAYPAPTFTVSEAYSVFSRICPDERFWALGYGLAGAYGLVGTIAAWPNNVSRWHTSKLPAIRMSSAVLVAFVHGMTGMFVFEGAPTSTGSGIYVLIMCSAYLLLRAEYERA